MKNLWTDRRLFLSTLCVVLCAVYPGSAALIATISGFYLANRAFVDGKVKL